MAWAKERSVDAIPHRRRPARPRPPPRRRGVRLRREPPKDNPNWRGPWDCAEFASWLVYQVSGRLYGCADDAGDPARADAYTGPWEADVRRLGTAVSVEDAARTPGAFLLRPPGGAGKAVGHIALSDGAGGTVEAMDRAHGVCTGSVHGRTFTLGVVVPWIDCVAGPAVPVRPIKRWLEAGSTGARVKALQRALAARHYDPGGVDGAFGPHTLAAVVAFQRANGLVPDGVVGPQAAKALGTPG
jgi:hypothetical protein